MLANNSLYPNKQSVKKNLLNRPGASFNSLQCPDTDNREASTEGASGSSYPCLPKKCHKKSFTPYNSLLYKAGYKDKLSQAYGDFINSLGERIGFSWFCTFTFKEPVHPESATKRFNRFIHKLNRKIYGCRYYKRKGQGVQWVKALEYQKRGVLHFHCLIASIPDTWNKSLKDLRRLAWMDIWFKSNGIARIVQYDKTKGASYYLGKYIYKGGELDYSSNIADALHKQLEL